MLDARAFQNLKRLCRIECTPEEEQAFHGSLQRVLSYIEQLSEVPTEGVPSCSSVLKELASNPLRDDVVADPFSRELFLANAPDQIGGMIRVPPVLK